MFEESIPPSNIELIFQNAKPPAIILVTHNVAC